MVDADLANADGARLGGVLGFLLVKVHYLVGWQKGHNGRGNFIQADLLYVGDKVV